MTNNNTKYIVKDVIILGPGELKKRFSFNFFNAKILPKCFLFSNRKYTCYYSRTSVKDYLNRDNKINEDPIISYLEELIEKGKDESLVFGDVVDKAYSNYELRHLISNDKDLYKEYKQKDKDTGCKTIYTRKRYQYGKIISIKWF